VERITMKTTALMLLLLLLAAVPSTYGQSTSTSIQYGRSWPRSMAVDGARGLVYVDGLSGIYPPTGYSFGIVNVTTRAVDRVVPLNVTAGEMAIDESSGNVYVAGSTSIEVFDGKTQAFAKEIKVGVPVFYILYDIGSGNLFFTNGLHSVFEVDPRAGTVLGQASVGNGAEGLALDQSSGELFVADYLSGSISVLSSSALALEKTIALPSPCNPSQIALNQRTHLLYSTTGVNTIDVVDTAADTFVKTVTVAPLSTNSTSAIALDEATNSVFVLTGPGTTITQVDGSSDSVVGRLAVGSPAYELAVNQAKGELYVTVYHQISVFGELQGGARDLVGGIAIPLLLLTVVGVLVVFVLFASRRRAHPIIAPSQITNQMGEVWPWT
jgi:DNA-binding beta-propeller fold protein YncE